MINPIYMLCIYKADFCIIKAENKKDAIKAYKDNEKTLHYLCYVKNAISYDAYKKACRQMIDTFKSIYKTDLQCSLFEYIKNI